MEEVTVREVGPRDGLQMVKSIMPTAAKIRWIDGLVAAGLRHIEVGSMVPPKVLPQMADTAEVAQAALRHSDLTVSVLTPNLKGVQRAVQAGVRRVNVPVSVSESHSQSNTRRSTAEAIEEVGRIAAWSAVNAPELYLEVGCATAFGCSLEGQVSEARVVAVAGALVRHGAHSVMLADTVGYANPTQVKRLVVAVRSAIGDRLLGLHLHDTFGLGLANAFAGLEVGVRFFDAALAGLGGCPFAPGAAGNIVTEDLLFLLKSMGMATGVDLDALLRARKGLVKALPTEKFEGHFARVAALGRLPVNRGPTGDAAALSH